MSAEWVQGLLATFSIRTTNRAASCSFTVWA